MLSKKKRNDNGDDDNTMVVDSRQRRIITLVYVYVFMMMMKSEISFVWHVSNLTPYLSHLFYFRFHLIVLLIKKKEKENVFNILSSYDETSCSFFACHIIVWLFIITITTISTFFLIRFKDRKLYQRSALQVQICLSCNEKIEKKKKKSSWRLCLST